MNIVFKEIKFHKIRFFLASTGIGLLIMMVISMDAIYKGMMRDAICYIKATEANIWVCQKNKRGPFVDSSMMPADVVNKISSIQGVREANPIIYRVFTTRVKHEVKRFGIIGYDLDKGGGPLQLIEGRKIVRDRKEIVVDELLGLKIGQKVPIRDDLFEIVGITKGMCFTADIPLVFISLRDAQNTLLKKDFEKNKKDRKQKQFVLIEGFKKFMPFISPEAEKEIQGLASNSNMINAVFVTLSPGYDPYEMARKIIRWEELSALTQGKEIELILNTVMKGAKEQMGMFRTMLIVAAGVIVAMILFASTVENTKEIAILKVIGIPNSTIVGMIIQQAALIGIIGNIVGFILIFLMKSEFPMPLSICFEDVAALFTTIIIVCIVSSLLGVTRALKIDPMAALGR
ncbi:MAG: ABC transporter permease [bacterium]